jgi:hypothetical protein
MKNYLKNKQNYSLIESDLLDSELRILDWIFYQVCKDQQIEVERNLQLVTINKKF